MNKFARFFLILLITLPFAASVSFAKTKADKKREAKVDFEDELVEGQLKKPNLFNILRGKDARSKKLIKLRKDFIPEMRGTAEDLSGNNN